MLPTLPDVQTLWDNRFKQGMPSLTEPDPFFVSMYEQHIGQLFPTGGTALDLAAGIGRHSLYLAIRQWQVTAVDISPVAMTRLGEEAENLNVRINTIPSDTAHYDLHPDIFDLIIVYYHFDRQLFDRAYTALKPGGLFICKLAVSWSSAPATTEKHTPLQKNELLSFVTPYKTISHTERPAHQRGVVEYLGRK